MEVPLSRGVSSSLPVKKGGIKISYRDRYTQELVAEARAHAADTRSGASLMVEGMDPQTEERMEMEARWYYGAGLEVAAERAMEEYTRAWLVECAAGRDWSRLLGVLWGSNVG